MKIPRLLVTAGAVAMLTTANLTAQPFGGGGGFGPGNFDPSILQQMDPAVIQQMAAGFQQTISQVDPAQLQQMAGAFNPEVAQMDPAQFQQMFDQWQQQVQEFVQMDPSQVQDLMNQWQQGGLDPSQFQPVRVASLREQMGITNDVEWSVIEERIQKVREAQRAVQGDSSSGITPLAAGANQFAGFSSPPQRSPDQRGVRQASAGTASTSSEVGAVQRAIENRAPDEQTKSAIDRLLDVRKNHLTALQKAQASLREVLTIKQEAVATVNGLL